MYSRCRPTGSGSSRSVGSLAISRSTSQTASASGGIRWRIRRRICVRVVTPGALFSYRRGNIELGARCCTCEAYRRRIVPSEYSDYREYVLDPAIADDCRSAGYARGQLPNGAPVVLNKDVCEGIWFRCATTGPRASCRASASTARCRRPATVLSRAVGHGKSPWRLNRDQIREIEAIEAAARSSGACGSQSPRGIGDCQACQPARSKLELGACLDRAGTERAWTSAGASVGSADSDDLRSRGGLNARLAGRRYF